MEALKKLSNSTTCTCTCTMVHINIDERWIEHQGNKAIKMSNQIIRLNTFASCLPGLEPLLCGELTRLGASPRLLPGGALFNADPEVCLKRFIMFAILTHLFTMILSFMLVITLLKKIDLKKNEFR